MAIPDYPTLISDEPDIETWKQGIVQDPTLKSPKGAGLTTTRSAFDRTQKSWEFSYALLSDTDKQILERFERDTVKYGVVSFHWQSFQEAYGCDPRTNGMTIPLGRIVQPRIPNGRSYKCIIAGITHASVEPTWPTSINGTVTDGTVTWRENTYRVRFSTLVQYAISRRIDFWKVLVGLEEV